MSEDTPETNQVNDEERPLSLESLSERIQFLEAQNAGLKRVGGLSLILLLLVGGLFVSQVWRDLKGLASGGLVFLDEDRKDVAALMVTPRGNTALIPVGLSGPPHLDFAHAEFNGLGIYDSLGRLRIVLGTTPDGERVILGALAPDGKVVWAPLGGKGSAAGPSPGPAGPGATPLPSGTPAPASTPTAIPTAAPSAMPTAMPSPPTGTPNP